jgi:hypothetical protein
MKRRLILGIVAVLTAALPLLSLVGMVTMRDIPITNWYVVYRGLIVAGLMGTGVLMMVISSRSAEVAALVAWMLFLADGVWGIVVLWPLQSGWPAPLNIFFLGVGAIVVIHLVIAIRRHRPIGNDIAV